MPRGNEDFAVETLRNEEHALPAKAIGRCKAYRRLFGERLGTYEPCELNRRPMLGSKRASNILLLK